MILVAFDLETAHVPDKAAVETLEDALAKMSGDNDTRRMTEAHLADLKAVDPRKHLGIACIGLSRSDKDDRGDSAPLTWSNYGVDQKALWEKMLVDRSPEAKLSCARPRMTQREAFEQLTYLHLQAMKGLTIVTWNGLFDWHVLGVESGALDLAALLCLQHVDLMFAFHAVKGFPLGLKAAAAACGSHKGAEGIESGALAPELWAQGKFQEVLAYVEQDARATLDVALYLQQHGGFTWTTQAGRKAGFSLPHTDYSKMRVMDVLGWPSPDQSWINKPLLRSGMTQWIKDALEPYKQLYSLAAWDSLRVS